MVDCHIIGKQLWRLQDRICYYSPLEEAMQEVGLEKLEDYVLQRQNTSVRYIAAQINMDLFE